MTQKVDLRQVLTERVLVGDGAMGTYLYQMGFPVGVSYEEFNLTKPEVVMDVHKRYYEAGARLIETNTYSASREKLSKFGLDEEVGAINRAGVELARRAVGPDAYVLGAIGSLNAGRRRAAGAARIAANVTEQAEALLDAGADGLILETYYTMEELAEALRAVRKIDSKVPVICQFATDGSGLTLDGVSYADAFARLEQWGADVVGFNCHSGPNGILRALERLVSQNRTDRLPLSVFPNAGLPSIEDGRTTYLASPDYFAKMVDRFLVHGVSILGGCCGTTPAHISAMAKTLEEAHQVPAGKFEAGLSDRTERMPSVEVVEAESGKPEPPADGGEPTLLDLVKQRHTVIVELDSPRDLSITNYMKGAEALKQAGIDAITLADNSLAQARMSNVPLGFLLKEKLGVRPLLHIACRDRNLIGTQSHLMGLHALGINHILAITGDPARVGDLPGASSVYDLTSFDLIRMTKQLNEGVAFSGKPLKQRANFIVGAAFDPNVRHLGKAVQRMEKKLEAGADFFMPHPVYAPALIRQIYEATRHIEAPIFLGIMPLISGRNADYLHHEVPGIKIPEDMRKRMAGLGGEEGRRAGCDIAKELLDEALRYFRGIYLMTPMMFYEITAELTRYIRTKTGQATPGQSGHLSL